MAAYTTEKYNEAIGQEFDIFKLPPFYTDVEKMYYIDTRPTSQITTENSPVEFNISGQGIDYFDLSRTKLHVKAKITKSDGTAIGAEELVTPTNNWLHSLWSQVDVSLNGQLITNSSNMYAYKSYLKTVLNGTKGNTQLEAALYFKDVYDMDSSDVVAGANLGVLDRGGLAAESKVVDMEGCLCEDIFNSKRYLINGVNLQIKLYRTSTRFNVTSEVDHADYRVQIVDVYLRLCKIRPSVGMITSHAKMLEQSTAKYPITKTDIKAVSIPKGQLSYTIDNLFQNKSPNKIVVALVSAEAFNGNYKKNPFNFLTYELSTIALYVDGESLPSQPISVSSNEYVTLFNNLFEDNSQVDITRSDFENGYAMYQFTLEPKHIKEEYLDLIKQGNLRLQLQFKTALPETINCIIYSEDNLLFEVDQARNIIYSSP